MEGGRKAEGQAEIQAHVPVKWQEPEANEGV